MTDISLFRSKRRAISPETGQKNFYVAGDDGHYVSNNPVGYHSPSRWIDIGGNLLVNPSAGLMTIKNMALMTADDGVTIPLQVVGFGQDTDVLAGDLIYYSGAPYRYYVCTRDHHVIKSSDYEHYWGFNTQYYEGDIVRNTMGTYFKAVVDSIHSNPFSPFAEDTYYEAGTIVSYFGNYYRCNESYTSGHSDLPSWQGPGHFYWAGDKVRIDNYGHSFWICTRNHTSTTLFDDDWVNGNWDYLPQEWGADGVYYYEGDWVRYYGVEYRCLAYNTSSSDFYIDYDAGYWIEDTFTSFVASPETEGDWSYVDIGTPTNFYPEEWEIIGDWWALENYINPDSWSRYRWCALTLANPQIAGPLTWSEAVEVCRGKDFGGLFEYAGFTDWFLPNVNEGTALADYGRANPCADPNITAPKYTWTSTTNPTSTTQGWGIDLSTNGVTNIVSKAAYTQLYARPVRYISGHPMYGSNIPPTGQAISYQDGDDAFIRQRTKWKVYSTPWKEAGTVINETGVGVIAWNNPTGAQTEEATPLTTSNSAYVTTAVSSQLSNWLKFTNFGFSSSDIPEGMEIIGVELELKKGATVLNAVRDQAVRLVIDGVVAGDSKPNVSVYWSNTSQTVTTYGNASEKWGLPLVRDNIVNNNNFGFVLNANIILANTVYVNVGRVRVHYCQARYIDNGDGTVSDPSQGLMYVKNIGNMIPGPSITPTNQIDAYISSWNFSTNYTARNCVNGTSGWNSVTNERWICLVNHTSHAAYPAWAVSTAYAPGNIVRDASSTSWYICNVGHNSGTGTFSAYRTANPTHWTRVYPFDLDRAANPTYWIKTVWNGGAFNSIGAQTWANLVPNAEALEYAGYNDWRVANLVETFFMTDKSKASPCYNKTYFSGPPSSWTFSSTTNPASTTATLGPYFAQGNIRSDSKVSSYQYILVRSIKGN